MKKWYQIAIIVILILGSDYITAISEVYEQRLGSVHNVVTDQGRQIQSLREKNEEQEERYNQMIIKIAENIKRNDSFLTLVDIMRTFLMMIKIIMKKS